MFKEKLKGTKTQVYRDMVSYLQKQQVIVPDPKDLPANEAKLVNKWYREHVDLEYVMDAANKTEKISAPTGKHDDYCDSTAIGLHGALSMLPVSGNFAAVSMPTKRAVNKSGAGWTGQPLLYKEDDSLYLIQGAYDHHLKKINARNGELIWQYKFDDVVKGTGTIWHNKKAKSKY